MFFDLGMLLVSYERGYVKGSIRWIRTWKSVKVGDLLQIKIW